jgi:tetratricopeptide (TPR) repeat protein
VSTPLPPGGLVQNVTAVAGFAYGVIGADLHVLGDGTPLYVLENYQRPGLLDSSWLQELPSRMLSARNAVVGFTGREREREHLREWSRLDGRLAVRWLHAPGGRGKTRLASRVAEDLIDTGWKVVTAAHGPGAVLTPLRSQDLRLDGAAGLLLIVDYADRWPLTHLTWLLSNALLHQSAVPTRVLLLARTAYAWPALCGKLDNYQAGVSQQLLSSLPNESGHREQAFLAARDSFAAHYGVADPSIIASPTELERPEWGLTLTVHMAALVAVDAYVHGRAQSRDPNDLTSYLLNRERAHWTHLYENRARLDKQAPGLDFQTPPSVMSRTVFTATLTGPTDHLAGKVILDGLDLELSSERVLTDHTACYPPADPRIATVLEPLYPDRLGEDFVALTVPGHCLDQPAYAWAHSTAMTILSRSADHAPPAHTSRAITLLASAAERWPHVGETFLYPLLRRDLQLAVDAGSAALTVLASIPGIPADILEGVEDRLPPGRHLDLDLGIAAIAIRLAEHRLSRTQDPAERARIHYNLGIRLSYAGQHQQAALATEKGLAGFRRLADTDPTTFKVDVARALTSLGIHLSWLGRRDEALTAAQEAVEILRQLAIRNPTDFKPELAASVSSFGRRLAEVNRHEEAVIVAEDSVAMYRSLSAANPAVFESELSLALDKMAGSLKVLGRFAEAVAAAQEAVQILRRLTVTRPAVFEPDLAPLLSNLSIALNGIHRHEEALAGAEEAVELYRKLAAANPAMFALDLSRSLRNLGSYLAQQDRGDEALAALDEALEINRMLAAADSIACEPDLASTLGMHAWIRVILKIELSEALDSIRESVKISRRWYDRSPEVFSDILHIALDLAVDVLAALGRGQDAMRVAQRAGYGLLDQAADALERIVYN